MSDVQSNFLDALARHFPLPTGMGNDPQGWALDYVDALKSFSAGTLEAAAKQIIRERAKRSYPLPAECREICAHVVEAENLRASVDKKTMSRKNDPAFEDWRWKNADKLFAGSKFAQQSLTEDWAWTFHTWLISNQREPDGHEANKIRADGLAGSKRFDVLVGRSNQAVENTRPSMFARKFIDWKNAANARLKQVVTIGA